MAASRSAREDWSAARREVVEAIRSGRLTRQEASRELGVSTEAIRRWVARERASAFVAVDVRDGTPSRGAATVEIVVAGGRVLRVPVGLEAADLVRLVRALESC